MTKDVVAENRGMKRVLSDNEEEIETLYTQQETWEHKLETALTVLDTIQDRYRDTVAKHSKEKRTWRNRENIGI